MNGSGQQETTGLDAFVSSDDKPWAGFEELAMPLFNSLYNFARWLARDEHDADDLVQETYRKALHGFSSFEPGTNFEAWIFRILKNTFLNSRASLQWRKTVVVGYEEDGLDVAVENETPETILIERSNQHLVQSAIDTLPSYFREPLVLCEMEEMSYQEIAHALSIPIGTVMSRLSRARKATRAFLDKLGNQQHTAKQRAA